MIELSTMLASARREFEMQPIRSMLKNLLHGSPPVDVRSEWARLHEALTQKLVEAADLPVSFPWSIAPAN